MDEIKIVNVAIIYKQDIHNEMEIVRKKLELFKFGLIETNKHHCGIRVLVGAGYLIRGTQI